ncbi:hypothetical protein ACQCX5_06775 [Propionibacteriaceae bacterium G57]|uniref:hypothetical protein n=1 Tax=Aestuariimicrobium sp. G57 TaxID=3418485 RepID=UPI003DA6FFF0
MEPTRRPWLWKLKVVRAIVMRDRSRLWKLRLEQMEGEGDPAAESLRGQIRDLPLDRVEGHVVYLDLPGERGLEADGVEPLDEE